MSTFNKGYQSIRITRNAKGHNNDRSKKRLNYTRGFKSMEREPRWNKQLEEYNNTPKSDMEPIQMEPTQMEIKKIPKDEVLQLIESYKEVIDSIITNIIDMINSVIININISIRITICITISIRIRIQVSISIRIIII